MNVTLFSHCRLIVFVVALTVIISLLSACSQAVDVTEPVASVAVATETSRPATPVPTTPPAAIVVDSAELIIRELFPVEVAVKATGNLADGCTRIDGVDQQRSASGYNISIRASRDADLICTQALVPFEETIELDVVDLPAGAYNVNVNEVQVTFVLATDNIMISEPTVAVDDATDVAANLFTLTGRVFHDLCAVSDDGTNEPSEGCVEQADGGLSANGVLDADEPGLTGISVSLVDEACPDATDVASASPEPVATAETNPDGFYAFPDLAAGQYCLFVDASTDPNASALVPGQWTTPSPDSSQTIAINADSTAAPIGWDYQLLPILEAEQGESPIRAGCIDLFAFDGDVTIPDDTPFEPDTAIVKTWRLINTGSCIWNSDYALVFAGGDQMNAPPEVALEGVIAPGDAVNVTVEMTAPSDLGSYRGEWLMRSDFDKVFGLGDTADQPIWLQIEVVEPDTVGGIRGVMWHDQCDQSAYTFGDPTLPAGCLQNANGTIRGDGIYDTSKENPLPNVTINIGNGACGDTEFVRSLRTADNGTYAFPNLLAGTYCIYIEVLTQQNYNLLIPGNFTVPQPGRSGITVTIEPNAEFDSINFAWDFLEE